MLQRLIAGLAAAAFLAACARREVPASPEGPSPAPLAVGLLTPGSIADDGWNAAAYEGLRRIQAERGARVAHREARKPAARHDAVRQLAAAGGDVVFAMGEEFQDAVLSAAPGFPETVFVVAEGDLRGRNLVPVSFRIEEAAWLLGMAAGAQSKTGRAGAVALRSRAAERAFAAFRGGAEAMRPGFVLEQTFVADPDDAGAARAAAIGMIDGGADVVFQMAGDAGRGAIAACAERGVLCFAAPRKINDRAPDAIGASAVVDAGGAMIDIVSLVDDGRFTSRPFSFGMREGIVTVAWNEKLRNRIPADAIKRIDDTQAAILEGRFTPPRDQ